MDAAAESFLIAATAQLNTSFTPTLLLPGDPLLLSPAPAAAVLGAGLCRRGENVVSTAAGASRYRPPHTYSVMTVSKQYRPRVGDQVVGVVEDRGADWYRVNILSGSTALLPRLAFDGATKRNRPDLRRGAVVYCRVSEAERGADTQLSCASSSSSIRRDWSSGEAVYGELLGGLLLRTTSAAARNILRTDNALLNTLGTYFEYEAAIGMNGAVWIAAASVEDTIAVRNAVQMGAELDDSRGAVLAETLARHCGKDKTK